jgi:hypothetical protein
MMSLAAVTQTGPDDRVVHFIQELTEARVKKALFTRF